jgi:CheY-like chemotaxis protein
MSDLALIVDDNPTDMKLQSEILQLDGFAVHKAGDAESAQRLLESLVPDVILMDIALPGMDGLMLTKLIKSDPRFRQVPVIALTAFAMKGDDRAAVDAGCDGYITKPIDTRRFAEQVRNVQRMTRLRFSEAPASRQPQPRPVSRR